MVNATKSTVTANDGKSHRDDNPTDLRTGHGHHQALPTGAAPAHRPYLPVLHLNAGKVRHEGAGLAFWFRPLSAVISEIPVDDRELPLVAHAVVGQDGLVANTAKYLDAQPVIGIDPEPGRNPGVLVTHRPNTTEALLLASAGGKAAVQHRAMVRATLDDGQQLDALNEIYIGHPSHQSARYQIAVPGVGEPERQSSSGLIATSGTGATGWAASISRERVTPLSLPGVTDQALAWFVRETWPSPATGTSLTCGLLNPGDSLRIVVESDALVVFGDGLETDRVTATWGQNVTIGLSARSLRLIV